MKVIAKLGPSLTQAIEVELRIDTTAFHTILPEDVAIMARIAVSLKGRAQFDGPVENLGLAFIQLLDREGSIPVVLRSAGEPVLGFSALQCLGLRLNATTGMLEHDRAFGPAMLGVRNV